MIFIDKQNVFRNGNPILLLRSMRLLTLPPGAVGAMEKTEP
jgi:hypothetical protein